MVWLRVCSASIGVPAAIRPMTGTATGRLPSSSAAMLPLLRTFPSVPSMTLGVKPRRLLPPALANSGSLITSIARARLGRRRMKPRSSSAVMRRWMPDFERRSSASFISSKEGGTPDSFRRSLMNRKSSYCLRVSISSIPPGLIALFDSEFDSETSEVRDQTLETNHERTLYVPYVFRNHLISRQRNLLLSRRGVQRHQLEGDQLGAISPAAAGYRKPSPRPRRVQTANGSQAPVPQRDFQAAKNPDGRPAWRSGRHRRATRGGRASSLRAGHWRRHRVRAAPFRERDG